VHEVHDGTLVPLSDYEPKGASSCTKPGLREPDCGFSLRIDKGQVTYGKRLEPIAKIVRS